MGTYLFYYSILTFEKKHQNNTNTLEPDIKRFLTIQHTSLVIQYKIAV